jgi:small subunit ribosomal protein S6
LRRYEGMFLFDSAATRDWPAVEAEVRRLLGRINAELVVCVKYDERKLAYEIKRRKRGTYALTYFDAPSERIAELERDVQLSDSVLRLLVLQAAEVTEERINQLKQWPADTPLQPLSSERRHDEHDRLLRDGHYGSREERPAARFESGAPQPALSPGGPPMEPPPAARRDPEAGPVGDWT